MRNIAIIMSPLEIAASLPFDLTPRHRFVKADSEQIDWYKSQLREWKHVNWWLRYHNQDGIIPDYENEVVTVDAPERKEEEYRPLPPERWRYFGVEFVRAENSGVLGKDLQHLMQAGALLSPELVFGYAYVEYAPGSATAEHGSRILAYLRDWEPFRSVPVLQAEDLKRLAEYQLLVEQDLMNEHLFIGRALERFMKLPWVPWHADLTIVGLFSVIEALLAHLPKPNDPTDSLTRQLSNKLVLVSKMFDRPLSLTDFGGIGESKLWKKLYACRSKVAHGDEPNFEDELRDKRAVVDVLRETAKRLLILGLQKPGFLADLRNC
jgi:hypothetical protein